MTRFSKMIGYLRHFKGREITRSIEILTSLEVRPYKFKNNLMLDDKPTRERPPSRPHVSNIGGNGPVTGKENQRKTINIDESEDTFHN